jgi:hypothetical protein
VVRAVGRQQAVEDQGEGGLGLGRVLKGGGAAGPQRGQLGAQAVAQRQPGPGLALAVEQGVGVVEVLVELRVRLARGEVQVSQDARE